MMSDVRVVSPRETVIEVDAHAVPGRPGVVTPELRVLHDGAVDAAGVAASSAVEASGSAGAAASSATAAATSASNAASSATAAASSASAADDAMQAASQAASDADQSRVGAEASALAAAVAEEGAVAAQEGLVAAREAAAGSASSAATSASEAVSSASSAATAQTGAEAARDAAEAAADTAETAATVAVTAKTLAEGFAGDAETARDQAVTAAAVLRDTGWRDVSAALHGDCTGRLLVRRIGARVTASFNITSRVTTNFMRIWQMPQGWRPVANWLPIGLVPYGVTGTALAVGPIGWTWLLDARRSQPLETDRAMSGELSWLTNDAFPSPAAYPGTPA